MQKTAESSQNKSLTLHNIVIKDGQLVKQSSYINGTWLEGDSTLAVHNPANTKEIVNVINGNVEEVNFAIKSAKNALKDWSAKSAYERAIILRRWFDLMMENQEDLAKILTLEQGKPLTEAQSEIAYGASFIEWFAEEGKRIYGDVIPSHTHGKRILVIKQPVGVVTAITPWNFPHAMITRKAAAALAAGCTFVVRPDIKTPLSALAIAELAERAGVPAGVFNVVIGDDAAGIGKVLTQHPDVAKFTFTGSTKVGKLLSQQCASTIKKVSMELGGNAPFIVFDDADIEAAVQGAIASKYRNAGQTCVCTNRFFVQKKVLATFTEQYIKAVKQLKLGSGFENNVTVGPMISKQAVTNIHQLVEDSIAAGAQLVLGGSVDASLQGCYYPPTILTQVTHDMTVAKDEIFGPISPIISFDTEAEVLAMANNTEYGLAAYFYSRDIGRVWRVAEGLEFGMVGINEGVISDAAAPFGGVKQSGNGREGSKYGLDDYLEIKYLCMGGVQ